MSLKAIFQAHADAMDQGADDEEGQGMGPKPSGQNERQAGAQNDGSKTGSEFRAFSGC
ncbi:MAG TPA: hypothetical protein VF169_03370 [Albitalea sp.]|uniref:hypothetical protein n=1 Tax=Piscinibacter sp. TaxID=1903157 RepID=UPI002ED63AED